MGFSTGGALKYCEEHNIDAYIPYRVCPDEYLEAIQTCTGGFIFNASGSQYECEKEGGYRAIHTYKWIKTDSKCYDIKSYRINDCVCGKCPLREACCGKSTKFKKLEESIDKPHYDRMHEKLTKNPSYAKRIRKIRSRTVEPILGTLINFLNLKKINSCGMASANKSATVDVDGSHYVQPKEASEVLAPQITIASNHIPKNQGREGVFDLYFFIYSKCILPQYRKGAFVILVSDIINSHSCKASYALRRGIMMPECYLKELCNSCP